jgi:hypothetical protein
MFSEFMFFIRPQIQIGLKRERASIESEGPVSWIIVENPEQSIHLFD